MPNPISLPPIHDNVLENNKPTIEWKNWFDSILQSLNNNTSLYNDHLVRNPDFNWSRAKGNIPTTVDGPFVEEWYVKGNSMIFKITPTAYSSTQDSSLTGSERYVNISITSVNSNEFIIYQLLYKKLSKLQNKNITFSARVKNNTVNSVKAKFYVGFDMTSDGTDEFSASSGAVYINDDTRDIYSTVKMPKIPTDNLTNRVTIALKLFDLTNPVNLDLYYIKPEIADKPTMLHVEHPLERYQIDNP